MVAGHLQEKRGYYYAVISYKDENGKRKTQWIATGLPVKGNKKRAEDVLYEIRHSFRSPEQIRAEELLFADYLEHHWLPSAKNSIEVTTYAGYENRVRATIAPYFRKTEITLKNLKPKDIQDFYTEQLKRVKGSTVRGYHAMIHKALAQAVKHDLIVFNPADRVDIPQIQQYIADYYTAEELARLFQCVEGDEMELLFKMSAFYGMRKSEVLGLKWSAINFEEDSFVVRHTVTKTRVNGRKVVVKKDRTKRKSSYRTMPLVKEFKEELLELKKQQAQNKAMCKRSYNRQDEEYVFVDAMGNLFDPERISRHFKSVLKKNGLREIRFHDTRHSSGSALCQMGVSMKEIQEWLGHSDFSTTANIYSHLTSDTKVRTAESMMKTLGMTENKESA